MSFDNVGTSPGEQYQGSPPDDEAAYSELHDEDGNEMLPGGEQRSDRYDPKYANLQKIVADIFGPKYDNKDGGIKADNIKNFLEAAKAQFEVDDEKVDKAVEKIGTLLADMTYAERSQIIDKVTRDQFPTHDDDYPSRKPTTYGARGFIPGERYTQPTNLEPPQVDGNIEPDENDE